MTIKISPITFNGTSKTDELDDSIVLFDEPLQIVGTNERQWNGTIYDLNTTDAAQWDGIITQNHDSKLTDVIGKAIGLFKNKQGIFIRGIKYATEINPVAVLAKNLLTHGFAPGFSCETLGPDPDENGIWHNHVVCGLSQVVHPNDKMAYAIVSNSLEEAEKAGFDTTELRKEMNSVFEPWKESFQKVNNNLENLNDSQYNVKPTTLYYDKYGRKLEKPLDLSLQVLYNKDIDQINEGINQMIREENATKIGNPWYDEFGRPVLNGGKGSGNFGHSGRPGLQGGSAGAGSSRGSKASTSKASKKSKSAKDLYKEKYEKDYQGDEIPDKPIDQITDKDIEHLDTQVRERLMKEKRKATGKQTYADAEKDYYDKIDETGYYDLDDTLYGLEDPAADELRYSLLSLTSQYSSLVHGAVNTEDIKEYEKGIKEAIKDSEKYADQLKEKDLKKRAKELIDYIKDAPTRFEEDNSLLNQRLNKLTKIVNGGKGSGNFGHSGRPGLQGGSAGEGTSHGSATSTSKSTTLSGEERYNLSEKADTNISKLSKATTTASKLSKKNDEIIAKANKSYEAQEKAFDEFYEKYEDDENYDDLYYERYDDGRHPEDFKAGLDNYKKFTREISDLKTKIEKSHSNYSKEQEKEFSWVGSDTEEEKAYDKHLKSLAEDSEYSVKYYKDDVDRLIKKYDSEEQKVGGISAYNFAKEFANQDIVKELKKIQKELK